MSHPRTLGTVLAVGLAGGLIGACDEEIPMEPVPDTTPPAAVTDLVLQTPNPAEATMTWTAPGDDGTEGRVVRYDIRISKTPLSEETWGAALRLSDLPTPRTAGLVERLDFAGLEWDVTYHAALKSVDDADNWSALSNVAVSSTPDATPPSAVTDLVAMSPLETSVVLTWTAPGDDHSVGTASVYDVRYSTAVVTDDNWDVVHQALGEPTPGPSGTAETFVVEGLTPNTRYHFALKTGDEVPRWSEISNRTMETTAHLPAPPEMVEVPAGSFVMGDGSAVCGADERDVTLTRPFRLGRTEVTNQQYLEALRWAYRHGHVTATTASVIDNLDGSSEELLDLDDPEDDCEIKFVNGTFQLRDAGHGLNPDHPVMEVSWFGAAAYCDWLSLIEERPRAYDHATWTCNGGDPYGAAGYRLPTDAEWEFAAQYDDERSYPWGNEAPDAGRAHYGRPGDWTAIVGSYPGGPIVDGQAFFDLAGNVLEWCNDWHTCSLGSAPEIDPTGPAFGTVRVARGGSWPGDVTYLLSAGREGAYFPTRTSPTIGFRFALSQ